MAKANIVFNLTYLGVTDLAFASSAPPKTQVKTALVTLKSSSINYILLGNGNT